MYLPSYYWHPLILLGRENQAGLSVLLKNTEKQNVTRPRYEPGTICYTTALPVMHVASFHFRWIVTRPRFEPGTMLHHCSPSDACGFLPFSVDGLSKVLWICMAFSVSNAGEFCLVQFILAPPHIAITRGGLILDSKQTGLIGGVRCLWQTIHDFTFSDAPHPNTGVTWR
jgi:hypothetical protein